MCDSIGSIHLHVDGLRPVVEKVLEALLVLGLEAEITPIVDHVAGPQRLNPAFASTYEFHTPGETGEEFDGVVTVGLRSRQHAIEVLRLVLPILRQNPGSVCEVEQIVQIGRDGRWSEGQELKGLVDQRIRGDEVAEMPRPSWPVEIHHAFSFDGERPELPELLNTVGELGLSVGGLFVDDGGKVWSNEFSATDELAHACRQHEALRQLPGAKVYTEAELVLGIWKF